MNAADNVDEKWEVQDVINTPLAGIGKSSVVRESQSAIYKGREGS